jgi:glycosyltransferase involved in cell wall biosynthesis
MEKIRVIELVAGLDIGSGNGGAELVGLQIGRLLDRGEFIPSIFSMFRYESEAERGWLDRLKKNGVSVGGLIEPRGRLLGDIALVFRELWKFTSRFRPHLINSHSERSDFLNLLIHIFHPIHPMSIRTIHLDQIWQTRPILGGALNSLFFPLLFSAEIGVSKTITEQLDARRIAQIAHKRAYLCYNGIDADMFNQPPRRNLDLLTAGLPAGRPRIGIIGRLTDQKGHSDLIQATKLISPRLPVYLIVIGSGPLESQLKEEAKLSGMQERIFFLGNRPDVPAILSQLDLVVSPSLWEGFPTVLLEAMSQEIPIVATNIAGTRELILPGITGTLVPARNPERLAEAIMDSLGHPAQVKALAIAAREYAAKFTIQNTVKCHAEIYKGLIR